MSKDVFIVHTHLNDSFAEYRLLNGKLFYLCSLLAFIVVFENSEGILILNSLYMAIFSLLGFSLSPLFWNFLEMCTSVCLFVSIMDSFNLDTHALQFLKFLQNYSIENFLPMFFSFLSRTPYFKIGFLGSQSFNFLKKYFLCYFLSIFFTLHYRKFS